jgi:plastocyanin
MSRILRIAAIATFGLIGALGSMPAATAGGGCHSGASEGRGTTIDLIDACFTPTTLFAEPGDTITFVNRDPFVHNVTGNTWGHFEDLNEGDRFTTSFVDEGVYPFACTYHPGMSGAIVIGDGDAGGATTTEPVTQPLAASPVPVRSDAGWLTAGAVGLAIGAAAGAGIATLRRRWAGRSSV